MGTLGMRLCREMVKVVVRMMTFGMMKVMMTVGVIVMYALVLRVAAIFERREVKDVKRDFLVG